MACLSFEGGDKQVWEAGAWVWERFPRVPFSHSRHKCYAQMGCAWDSGVPEPTSWGRGAGSLCRVSHSQGSRLWQLSWSQTDTPELHAGGYKPTQLPTPNGAGQWLAEHFQTQPTRNLS